MRGDWRTTEGVDEAGDLIAACELRDDGEVLKVAEVLLAENASERMKTPKDKLEECMRNTLRGVQAPAMPCEPVGPIVHRERIQTTPVWGSLNDPIVSPPLAVARKVGRKEIEAEPEGVQ